ncbi:MAG TPA: hypothetical protein PKN71_06525 [Bacillota bacterium]|nr:hypothetical protein [Bacillota bacterium]HQE24352.1 hypothetical protein [Syntrophomonadaceae bacterium]
MADLLWYLVYLDAVVAVAGNGDNMHFLYSLSQCIFLVMMSNLPARVNPSPSVLVDTRAS